MSSERPGVVDVGAAVCDDCDGSELVEEDSVGADEALLVGWALDESCCELDGCCCDALDDWTCNVVDAGLDVLDVANAARVELGCSVTTTILPQRLGNKFPSSVTPMMESAGTLTWEHCWLTASTILTSPFTHAALQLLTSGSRSLGKSSRVQPSIEALYAC